MTSILWEGVDGLNFLNQLVTIMTPLKFPLNGTGGFSISLMRHPQRPNFHIANGWQRAMKTSVVQIKNMYHIAQLLQRYNHGCHRQNRQNIFHFSLKIQLSGILKQETFECTKLTSD